MRIIAQKNNALNTSDFLSKSLSNDYIDGMSFNVTYTKDNKIVIFNSISISGAITNTINTSTLGELQGYEVILLDDVLRNLSKNPVKKDIYLNLAPLNTGIINDDNINEVTMMLNEYIDKIKEIIYNYKNLIINLHSINRNIVELLKQKLSNNKIGFTVTGNDLNFIDVDYYILIANTQNDAVIDMLLKNNKEVIIYVYSDYYISYLYDHYLGEKSTPYLQETFNKIAIMTNYPEIINKVFR